MRTLLNSKSSTGPSFDFSICSWSIYFNEVRRLRVHVPLTFGLPRERGPFFLDSKPGTAWCNRCCICRCNIVQEGGPALPVKESNRVLHRRDTSGLCRRRAWRDQEQGCCNPKLAHSPTLRDNSGNSSAGPSGWRKQQPLKY
ncbi:hypothetical protein [Bradyrhizobium sp. Tv2a-2]|uniref:hypothetical protein n=1 Tax=Bradyrhizobium sp. Tv2a-2 TaxID=113395 RepID=UPI0012EBC504|nr:hypothetical protein [Bradyrhizobium sp. Tv2a-2]